MSDIVIGGLAAVVDAVLDNAFESGRDDGLTFQQRMAIFLKHIRDNGPDEVMLDKGILKETPDFLPTQYNWEWEDLQHGLNHLICRLEAQEQTK